MKTIWILIVIFWFVCIYGADVENFGWEESVKK